VETPVETPTEFTVFSGALGTEDSVIDAIRAAKQTGKGTVSPAWTGGNEGVILDANKDLGTTGLVLVNSGDGFDANTNNSPAEVIIDGNGREIALTGLPGSPLITVGSGVTLTLKNITFKGMTNNTRPLILVNMGGTLIMETGAVITGNTNGGGNSDSNNSGGGVMVSGGVFKMKDGATISHNTSNKTGGTNNLGGGGVGVVNNGKFIMEGGSITNNVAQGTGRTWHLGGGGGVMVYKGRFEMSGGSITSNEARGTSPFAQKGFGGGVSVNFMTVGTTFVKASGGSISGNTADDQSNQVFVLIKTKNGVPSNNESAYTYRVINAPFTGEVSVVDENTILVNPGVWDGGNTASGSDNTWQSTNETQRAAGAKFQAS
jgi:hypothetical protein